MRKKLIPILISLLFLASACARGAQARNIGDTYRLTYVVIDADGAHVSGEAPTVKIQRASDGDWLDFSDDTFKASGWGEKTAGLTENATDGLYYYDFTPPESETDAEQYVFLVENTDEDYADHQIVTVEYQDLAENKYVNGVKDGGDYNGIEKMIRVQR